MHGDEELTDRRAEEGARVVVLALLSEADRAARALLRQDGEEPLHDFRVSLRRLRSAVRAFRPWLEGSVRREHEQRLARLARAIDAARDAAVQLAWLAAEREGLASAPRRAGLDFLASRLGKRRRQAERGHPRLVRRYQRTSARLRRRLSTCVIQLGGHAPIPFSAAAGGLLSEQLARLRARLGALGGASDERGIHRARIEAKRLRYLLEALRESGAVDPRPAVKHLKRLQALLGELHDGHVLAAEIADALAEVSAERARRLHEAVCGSVADRARARRALRASPRPGILAAARRLVAERDAGYAALERDWREGGIAALAADVQALIAALEARAGGALETRRRFRLGTLPPALADVTPREVQEGWLPGTRLRERVRRERGPSGERCTRALAQGAGRRRLALEEEVSREVFDVLWLLTAGHRTSRRRWEVVVGGLPWSVEEVAAGGPWMAEVRLPPHATEVALPDWLAPLVTGEVEVGGEDEPGALGLDQMVKEGVGAPVASP